ncbi:hypothetical protein ACFOY8_14665 [Thalassospira xianhensis]|uniref:Uncharacterized protein n=1 Tax=Thalassospira xianhensis MCCC 1A02616 TaxID=1177929 RepID=A0A367UHG8_9PROT|nr:hypothetical protein [Thalassospira xianhensis]RCK07609.1 hypothetical protein TH5_00575 [Thalassospira xianhensis MCCC 1A02616]
MNERDADKSQNPLSPAVIILLEWLRGNEEQIGLSFDGPKMSSKQRRNFLTAIAETYRAEHAGLCRVPRHRDISINLDLVDTLTQATRTVVRGNLEHSNGVLTVNFALAESLVCHEDYIEFILPQQLATEFGSNMQALSLIRAALSEDKYGDHFKADAGPS